MFVSVPVASLQIRFRLTCREQAWHASVTLLCMFRVLQRMMELIATPTPPPRAGPGWGWGWGAFAPKVRGTKSSEENFSGGCNGVVAERSGSGPRARSPPQDSFLPPTHRTQ